MFNRSLLRRAKTQLDVLFSLDKYRLVQLENGN